MFFERVMLGSAVLAASMAANANYLTNYGDANINNLKAAMADGALHVVQLGDSHTAGDVMTDALRNRLQDTLGDGGMGWAMPMYFKGQRMARFGYDRHNFQPISSRTNKSEDYTLGGMIAKPQSSGASITLKAKKSEPAQKVLVSVRQNSPSEYFIATDANGKSVPVQADLYGQWQVVDIGDVELPLTLRSQGSSSVLGGYWAFNPNNKGATVSALGINGAELSYWNRWNSDAWQNELKAIKPTLIALAYGTNEAYNGVSGERVRSILTEKVEQIRAASPESAILIIGSPEALKNTAGSCGVRPSTLSDVQNAQRQVAQEQGLLYWDWQAAMGGSCSMKSWMNSGKATKDGVHFSGSGYRQLGNQLASDLLSLR
ncbi:hypothetical protein B0181_10635 [Moraxella caviae]|uniref:GDSL-like Lipase/Acylhydrolase n=1 Tax=Moraxella caviae TaxID=34060 RepID=A0A1S9ZUV5_9GAMM|nr:GDSL-type esterase/lipase family protein [Moraxella caviae]OOR87244.1 hypothetical protein B0181_10635 [Moraxella caviae]STZ14822.1 GDSL-like Lipase/Acylhydrolase [Moraxella caviae]VEW11285.1 GDSL-like Lipase/Acylhydrolase [Moraxella caviae]